VPGAYRIEVSCAAGAGDTMTTSTAPGAELPVTGAPPMVALALALSALALLVRSATRR
jgi:hypothetical protein